MSSPISITRQQPPTSLVWSDRSDVVLYPASVTGGRGTYPAQAVEFADELTAAGVSVSLWHDPADADVFAERDPITAALVGVVLGIASSAAWDGLKLLLRRRRPDQPVQLTIGQRTTDSAGQPVEQWVRIDGPANAVADTLDRLRKP